MEERAYPPLPEPLEGCALGGDVERVGVAAEAAPAAAAAAAAAAATPPRRQPAARRRGLHPGPRALAGERGADQNPCGVLERSPEPRVAVRSVYLTV